MRAPHLVASQLRLTTMRARIHAFATQPLTCDTKFIFLKLWCDESIGNGIAFFLLSASLGYMLNRVPLIFVHRAANCSGPILAFHPHTHIVHSDRPVVAMAQVRAPLGCAPLEGAAAATLHLLQLRHPVRALECDPIGGRPELLMVLGTWTNTLSHVMANPSLTVAERNRGHNLFEMGMFAYQVLSTPTPHTSLRRHSADTCRSTENHAGSRGECIFEILHGHFVRYFARSVDGVGTASHWACSRAHPLTHTHTHTHARTHTHSHRLRATLP